MPLEKCGIMSVWVKLHRLFCRRRHSRLTGERLSAAFRSPLLEEFSAYSGIRC